MAVGVYGCCCCRGGVKWSQITPWQAERFQENIVRTILQLERTFFEMAEGDSARNVLVACDRGALDPSACQYDIL